MLINSWLTCPLSSLVLLHILSRAWSKDPPGVAFFFPVACKDSKSLTLTRLLLNTDYCNPLVSKIDGMVKKVNSFFFHTVNLLHCISLVMSIMYSYLNWLNLEHNISYCLELLAPLRKMYLEIPYVTIASTVLPPLPPVTWNLKCNILSTHCIIHCHSSQQLFQEWCKLRVSVSIINKTKCFGHPMMLHPRVFNIKCTDQSQEWKWKRKLYNNNISSYMIHVLRE